MDRIQKIINSLVKTARTLPIEEDAAHSSRHYALIVTREGLWYGVNTIKKSHPLAARFGKNPEAIYPHAELNSIINALRDVNVDDIKNGVMYVVRVDKTGRIGNSKPCEGCMRALISFGFKSVYYSTETGYEEINIGED